MRFEILCPLSLAFLRTAAAVSGKDTICIGDRHHTLDYEIDGDSLDTVENATISVRPAPEMNGTCGQVGYGWHKLLCLGANVDASCSQARQALAFNEFVECTNCFAGASADLVFDMRIAWFMLQELRVGFQDVHLRGALEIGSSVCASESIAKGSLTLMDAKAKIGFWAGILPISMTLDFPATVEYSLGVEGSFQALAGLAVDINVGDHYFEWTRQTGFRGVNEKPTITVSPIAPSVFAEAGGSVELALRGSARVEVDKVASYRLGLSQDLPVKVEADFGTKTQVCVDASYDFAVEHEADVHFRLLGTDHDIFHWGPVDLFHEHKDQVFHECFQPFGNASQQALQLAQQSSAFSVLPHCADGEQYGWPKFDSMDELLASPWANYFKRVYGEVPTSGYPICTLTLSHLYKPAVFSAGLPMPAIEEHCPTEIGQYYSTMTDHQDSWSVWIWNPNLAQPSFGGLPDSHWVEIIHQSYVMDGSAAWMYYAPGTAIWFDVGATRVYNDHDEAVLDLLGEACEGGGGWGPFAKECVPQFPRLYSAAIEAGLNSFQFLLHADMVCGVEQVRRNMAIEIVDLGGPGTTSCGKLTSGRNRYRGGWEARHECVCDNCQGTVNCRGFGINGAPSLLEPPRDMVLV